MAPAENTPNEVSLQEWTPLFQISQYIPNAGILWQCLLLGFVFLASLYILRKWKRFKTHSDREVEVIEIAALGRPFKLGSLYDYRRDHLFEGHSCAQTIGEDNVTKSDHNSTEVDVFEDTLIDKYKAIGMSVYQKLSHMANTFVPEGSFKFLQSESKHSVILKHTFKSHSISCKSRSVLNKGFGHIGAYCSEATHVVVGIEYCRVLYIKCSNQIFPAPCGAITIQIKQQLANLGETVDATLIQNVYSDAINTETIPNAQALRTTLQNVTHIIPNKILLLPIDKLLRIPLVSPQECMTIDEITNLKQEIENLKLKLAHMQNQTSNQCLLADINKYEALLCKFEDKLSASLSNYIEIGETGLDQFLKSPFIPDSLIQCLSEIEEVDSNFQSMESILKDIRKVRNADNATSVNKKTNVIFVLQVPRRIQRNRVMEQMETYLLDSANYVNDAHPGGDAPLDYAEVRNQCELFVAFRNANISSKCTPEFLWCEIDLGQICRIIKHTHDGTSQQSENFIIPSAPRALALNLTEDGLLQTSLRIKWNHPESGEESIMQYQISLTKVNGSTIVLETSRKVREFECEDINTQEIAKVELRPICLFDIAGPSVAQLRPIDVIVDAAEFPINIKEWRITPYTLDIVICKPRIPTVFLPVICDHFEVTTLDPNKRTISKNICPNEDEASSYLVCQIEVSPGMSYYFKIDGFLGDKYLTWSNEHPLNIAVSDTAICKHKILQESTLYLDQYPKVYQLTMTNILENIEGDLKWFELGEATHHLPTKTIMMVGATGAGKTTLINGMINFILGVEWDDPYRFVLVNEPANANQAQSQTQDITVYTINHRKGFKVPYTLTLIDTPGFGDTRGIVRDKEITRQIKEYFTASNGSGVSSLTCICFVAQSSLPRLTITQQYIFDQILQLFGKDIGKNINMMLTFADAKEPQALSGIKEAGITYLDYFKFNNSALYTETDASKFVFQQNQHGSARKFDEMFWNMGMDSFKIFIERLSKMNDVSLSLTNKVLQERDNIQCKISGIQDAIKTGLNTLDTLRRELHLIDQHEADIKGNRNFKYTVQEIKLRKEDIPSGQYITNCLTCTRTCHEICKIADDDQKASCIAMDANGKCKICPEKCNWTEHKNMRYKIIVESHPVRKTYEDLRKRYKEAGKKSLSATEVVEKLTEDFHINRINVMSMAEEVRNSLDRLKEIALRPTREALWNTWRKC